MRAWPACALLTLAVAAVDCARDGATGPVATGMRIVAGDSQAGLPGDTLPIPLRVRTSTRAPRR